MGGWLVERDMLRKCPNEGIKCVRISNTGPSLIIVQWEPTRLSWVKINIYLYLNSDPIYNNVIKAHTKQPSCTFLKNRRKSLYIQWENENIRLKQEKAKKAQNLVATRKTRSAAVTSKITSRKNLIYLHSAQECK